jgi:peptidyl-prolyl cis-trans isomerase C
LILLGACLTLVSCSKNREDLAVAKVGDRVITLGTFEKVYFSVDPKFLSDDTGIEGRKEFLNTMINKDLMAIKAKELGYQKDPWVIQGMEAFKKVSLQAAYIKFRVADKINVTEKDVKEAYKMYLTTLQVKQILVDTKPVADEAYALLKQGTDFETVCRQYSVTEDAAMGGRVVNAVWGSFEPEFQDALFSVPVGGFTEPLISRNGWVIIKVIESNQPKRKPYEDVKGDLEKLLQRYQELRLTNKMSDVVRAKHNFQWYDENIGVVFDALPPDAPLTSPPDRSAEVYPLLRFGERDLDKPLVSYDNKSVTIRDFSDLYDRASFFTRPRRENRYGDIKKFLIDYVMNELVVIEMKESKIEEEPAVVVAMDKKREQFMVDKLYQDLIDKQTVVGPEEISAYYNDNIERFRRPEERRFGMILAGDKQTADEAYARVKKGEPFDTVAARYSIPELTAGERKGENFLTKGQQQELDAVGFSLANVGDVSEPFEISRGWAVLRLIERRPERIIAMEDATDEISRAIRVLKNEERLNSLLEKWRSEIKVEIYEKNLAKADIKGKPVKKPFSL